MRFIRLVVMATAATLAVAAPTFAQPAMDPSDPRLVPNPIEASDEGTAWACHATGPDVQCEGTLRTSWDIQDGPSDWCAVPLHSVNGTFTRVQTRYYRYDSASGQYLEY